MAIADNSKIQTPQGLFGGYAPCTVPGVSVAAGAAVAPRGAVVCLPPPQAGPGQGIALSTDPAAWPAPPPGAPLVTSLGPVRGGFAACRAAVGKLTAAVAEV